MIEQSLLSHFSTFSDLSAEAGARLAQAASLVEYEAGQEIFHEDDTAQSLFGVLEGQIDLILTFTEKTIKTEVDHEEAIHVRHVVRENPIVVETVGAGGIFGWSSMLIPAGSWTATAKCAAASRVLSLPAKDLIALFDEDPRTGYLFMRKLGSIISQRLHHRTDKLIDAWGEAFGHDKI